MLKNMTKIEALVKDKVFTFLCDIDSTMADVKEGIFQIMTYIANLEAQIKASQAKDIPPTPPNSPTSEPHPIPEPPMIDEPSKS